MEAHADDLAHLPPDGGGIGFLSSPSRSPKMSWMSSMTTCLGVGREPPPSLGVMMTAERKVWHRAALRRSMDDTVSISKALSQIKTDVLFWTCEVYEFLPQAGRRWKGGTADVVQVQGQGPWKGKPSKGKGAKSKFAGGNQKLRKGNSAKGQTGSHLRGAPKERGTDPPNSFGQGKGKHSDKPPPPEWADISSAGAQFCKTPRL